jgi:hypothetical protein
MVMAQLDEDEKIHAQKVILEQNFEKAETGNDPERKKKYKMKGWTDEFSFTRHYFELLRGAQISLRKLEEYQVTSFILSQYLNSELERNACDTEREYALVRRDSRHVLVTPTVWSPF